MIWLWEKYKSWRRAMIQENIDMCNHGLNQLIEKYGDDENRDVTDSEFNLLCLRSYYQERLEKFL